MFRVFYISYIIEIDFESTILGSSPCISFCIIPESDQAIFIIRMKVGRVPRDFEFPEDLRRLRIYERDDEERIDLLKSHEIEAITDESC